jgi:GNAT superfamily N-acetyltransferase
LRLRRATPGDAAEIVRLRAGMFASMGIDGGDPRWREACERHFATTLGGIDVVGYVVESGGAHLASCGVIEIRWRIPSPFNVMGRYAYISSMSTDDEWRGRGCARAVLEALLDEARRQDVHRVELHATPMGEPLYRSLGFTDRQGGVEMSVDLVAHH